MYSSIKGAQFFYFYVIDAKICTIDRIGTLGSIIDLQHRKQALVALKINEGVVSKDPLTLKLIWVA